MKTETQTQEPKIERQKVRKTTSKKIGNDLPRGIDQKTDHRPIEKLNSPRRPIRDSMRLEDLGRPKNTAP